MATLKVIKKRISSVKNTQKITRAMKMVAAAKLRKAQIAIEGSRPFVEKMGDFIDQIASKMTDKQMKKFPLFGERAEIKKTLLFIMTSNKGLCGGFNGNLLRKAEKFINEEKKSGKSVEIVMIGKKGREYFTAKGIEIDRYEPKWADNLSYEAALSLTESVSDRYKDGQVDRVCFMYNKFKSAISQEVSLTTLLPFEYEKKNDYNVDFIYEPNKELILNDLLPRFLAAKMTGFHKESIASELGSRMTAMDNATNNASDMINSLSLVYNRARQAAITTELMDIVNGAESLNK